MSRRTLLPEAESLERIRAVAVDETSAPRQAARAGARGPAGSRASRRAARLPIVMSGTTRRLVPVGRVDAQHVRAEAGEHARRHRSGQHAREVEHAETGQRTLGRRVPGGLPRIRIGLGDGDQRLARHREPCGCDAHSSGDRSVAAQPPSATTAASSSSASQRATAAATCSRSASTPSTRSAAARCAGCVGVEADPAAAARRCAQGRVVSGDRIPRRRDRPADRRQRESEPRVGESAIDRDVRLAEADRRAQLGCRDGGGGDGCGGEIRHRVRRVERGRARHAHRPGRGETEGRRHPHPELGLGVGHPVTLRRARSPGQRARRAGTARATLERP